MGIELWQVKAAYKQKALQNHPDRFPSEVKLEAEARFKHVKIPAHILLDYVPSALRLIVLFILLLEILWVVQFWGESAWRLWKLRV